MTHATGAPVADNLNTMTAGARGPVLLQDIWLLEKMAHFDREVIPERRMHAKGAGAFGTFTVTHDITKYTKAKIFSQVGKKTEMFARFYGGDPTFKAQSPELSRLYATFGQSFANGQSPPTATGMAAAVTSAGSRP